MVAKQTPSCSNDKEGPSQFQSFPAPLRTPLAQGRTFPPGQSSSEGSLRTYIFLMILSYACMICAFVVSFDGCVPVSINTLFRRQYWGFFLFYRTGYNSFTWPKRRGTNATKAGWSAGQVVFLRWKKYPVVFLQDSRPFGAIQYSSYDVRCQHVRDRKTQRKTETAELIRGSHDIVRT